MVSKLGHMVVGVDVGGSRKGYHVVAMEKTTVSEIAHLADPIDVLSLCRRLGASVVAVDAPCGWSVSGSQRLCEKELAQCGIFCFSTPRRDVAHAKAFYKGILQVGVSRGGPLYSA